MSHWIRITSLDECPEGSAQQFVAGEFIIALFRVEGELYALDGICPHQGGPLGKGALEGCIVTCPWHGFQFNVRNGQNVASPSLTHPQFAVKIEDGDVYVDIDS